MKKITMILLAMVFVFTLSACKEEPYYTNINNDELKEMLASDQEYQFIDVRTLEEYNEKKIEGFNLLMDLYVIEKSTALLDSLDKDIPVVLMCNSGNRSVDAAKIFEEYGFTEIYNLEEGIVGWIEEGNTVK